jgi:hypothetical protein
LNIWNATEAAARGAAYLDEVEPEWFATIDAASLDVSMNCNCLLGQRYGDFYDGLDRLDMRWADAIALGFQIPKALYLPDERREATFAELTAGWREEIARRRFARITQQGEVVSA